MSETPRPGHPHPESPTSGSQSNNLHLNNYSTPHNREDLNAYDQERVTSPAHGAVGVFQPPSPVRARGGPAVDPSLDIDSPFLDLFAATPAAPRSAAPLAAPQAPAEDDFDFG